MKLDIETLMIVYLMLSVIGAGAMIIIWQQVSGEEQVQRQDVFVQTDSIGRLKTLRGAAILYSLLLP